MALEFKHVRDITVSGFAADANPNTTNPAATAVFILPDRVVGQSADMATRGVSVYFRAVNGATNAEVTTASVDFTAWCKDLGATALRPGDSGKSRWTALAAEADAGSSFLYTTQALGDMFFQVTALNSIGAATRVEVWATARSL